MFLASIGNGSAIVFALTVAGLVFAEPGSAGRPNRLVHEKSPYLLEHAYNPVDWYPWGEEAFAKARRENKPIFLSIGYSTCHWCHVMALESFSDGEIADVLNTHYVAIKVDREERPDLDRVYLGFVEASTGSGGWPLNVLLTPELKPFFGGVYFPPRDKDGRPGLRTLLQRFAAKWKENPRQISDEAEHTFTALKAELSFSAGTREPPQAKLERELLALLRRNYDREYGGFGGAPKFPRPPLLEFLLSFSATAREPNLRRQALDLVVGTLRAMSRGGIHDHLGGGFHRYAVDRAWRVPHFEKMLYDQALLAQLFTTAAQRSGDAALRTTAEDIFRYVEDRLLSPEGGFYSAEDADSTKNDITSEGAFYLWTEADINRVLGDQAPLFCFAYGVTREGNTSEKTLSSKNVLYRAQSDAACAKKSGIAVDEVSSRLAELRTKLRVVREQRPRPARDEKIVTAWNGLMISAFARAGQTFAQSRYIETAERAAEFAFQHLYNETQGTLSRSYREGARDEGGFAQDYAFLIQGLLDLYEADFNVRWLAWAVKLQDKQDALFLDKAQGGYFGSAAGDASVLLRLKDEGEDAEPAANSITARNLVRLAEMLHREDWRDHATGIVHAFAPLLERDPSAMPMLLIAQDWLHGPVKEILVHGEPGTRQTEALIQEIRAHDLPRRVILRIDDSSRSYFAAALPIVDSLPATPEPPLVYVCEHYTCQLPSGEVKTLRKLLEDRSVPASR